MGVLEARTRFHLAISEYSGESKQQLVPVASIQVLDWREEGVWLALAAHIMDWRHVNWVACNSRQVRPDLLMVTACIQSSTNCWERSSS